MIKRGFAVVALALAVVATLPARAEDAKKKVLFLTKSQGFQHSCITRKGTELGMAEKELMKFAGAAGYEVTCTKNGSEINKENLAKYDVVAFYTTGDLTKKSGDGGDGMSATGKQELFDWLEAGHGVIGFHCASDTFHSGRTVDPYIGCIGGEFAGHGAQQKSTLKNVCPTFPGMDGFGDTLTLLEEWYTLRNVARDMQVMLLETTEGMKDGTRKVKNADGTTSEVKNVLYEGKPDYPETWVRAQGKGRVFYTSMGHREDVWTNAKFQQVVLAGLNWAAGKTQWEVKPNALQLAPGASFAPEKK